MIRDITLGQYYQTDSLIHRLDARTKLLATLLYMVSMFVVNNFWGFAFTILALTIVIALSHVPLHFMLRGLSSIFVIIAFTFIINLFLVPGRILISIGPLNITYEGLYRALFMALRLILLIVGSSLLTLCTRPAALTDAIESMLKPLGHIGVPYREISLMMTIALRFIPTLMDETDKIIKAQRARGADFESGNIIMRAKSLIPIIIPLFVSSFRIAEDLALAMEARCYGGETRTRLKTPHVSYIDYIAFILLLIYMIIVVLSRGEILL